jgi:hypothetical protein
MTASVPKGYSVASYQNLTMNTQTSQKTAHVPLVKGIKTTIIIKEATIIIISFVLIHSLMTKRISNYRAYTSIIRQF